jgi:hypothetical protein
MLYYIYVKSKNGENDFKTLKNILVSVRSLFDYILLAAVFFDEDYSRLYRNFCCKSFFYFSFCVAIDICIVSINIIVFYEDNTNEKNLYS